MKQSRRKSHSGRKRKITERMEQIITAMQDGDSEATLRDLQQEVKDETGETICGTTVWRVLKKNKFTTKKLHVQPNERYSDRTLALRAAFAEQELQITE